MFNFFGCLLGTFIGNALYGLAFNKYVEKKIDKDFEDRWLE